MSKSGSHWDKRYRLNNLDCYLLPSSKTALQLSVENQIFAKPGSKDFPGKKNWEVIVESEVKSPHQLLHFNAFLIELSSKFDSSEA